MIIAQERRSSKIYKDCQTVPVHKLYAYLFENKKGVLGIDGGVEGNITTKECSGVWVNNINVVSHVEIHELNSAEEIEFRCIKVTIENLVIDFSFIEQSDISFHVDMDKCLYDEGYCWVQADLEFKNCIICSQDQVLWKLNKGEENFVSFTNCVFREVSVQFLQKPVPWPDGQNVRRVGSSIQFKNTFFISTEDTEDGGFYIEAKADKSSSGSVANRMATHHMDEHVFTYVLTYNILVDNCYMDIADMTGTDLTLKGRNVIRDFRYWLPPIQPVVNKDGSVKKVPLEDLKPKLERKIYWGPHQKITPPDNKWQDYREFLLKLKREAESRQDDSQVNVLKREIMICDHKLIKPTSPWQDRITLWFNATFSDYGISWVRPLLLLLLLNLAFALLAACLGGIEIFSWETGYIYAKTFDPFSGLIDLGSSEGIKPQYKHVLIASLGVLQKIFLAICTYEIIRAGRRFTRV